MQWQIAIMIYVIILSSTNDHSLRKNNKNAKGDQLVLV